jgi:hypothetical protein
MSDDVHIRHRPTCTRPAPTARSVLGGVKHSCPECGGYFVVWDAPLDAPVLAPRLPVAAAYVCRDHHSEAVNFRGKGCKLCPTRKTNERKAFGRSDYTEMEIRT